MPCIQTKLMGMAATADGHWAATASLRDLLIKDCLCRPTGSSPLYIQPIWNEDKHLRYRSILWLTGSLVVGLPAARHVRQGDVTELCRRAIPSTTLAEVVYRTDGSVTIDARRLIDDNLRVGMLAEVAKLGRFDHRWMEHTTLTDMS